MRDINISGNHNVLKIREQIDLPLEESKTINISVKVNDAQLRYLKQQAKAYNLPVGALVRRAALNYLKLNPKLRDLHRILEETI